MSFQAFKPPLPTLSPSGRFASKFFGGTLTNVPPPGRGLALVLCLFDAQTKEITPNLSKLCQERFLRKSGSWSNFQGVWRSLALFVANVPPGGGHKHCLSACLTPCSDPQMHAPPTHSYPAAVIRMPKQHYHMQEGSAADGGAVKEN